MPRYIIDSILKTTSDVIAADVEPACGTTLYPTIRTLKRKGIIVVSNDTYTVSRVRRIYPLDFLVILVDCVNVLTDGLLQGGYTGNRGRLSLIQHTVIEDIARTINISMWRGSKSVLLREFVEVVTYIVNRSIFSRESEVKSCCSISSFFARIVFPILE